MKVQVNLFRFEVVSIFILEVLKENLFIISMLVLVVSNLFLRKYYKVEDGEKNKGKKFHVISIIIYSIAVTLFVISILENYQ